MEAVLEFVGNAIYGALALVALWGLFCVLVVWRRVSAAGFRSEDTQDAFLDEVDRFLAVGDFESASALCNSNPRAVSQLAGLTIDHRQLGYAKLRAVAADRFQRDYLADLEYRLSWVNTVIKAAPMLGLLGTVIGMMGAFSKLAGSRNVSPDALASDISVALITTALGLSIAIPLVLCMASINVRIRKLEDLTGAGLTRFFESFKEALKLRTAA